MKDPKDMTEEELAMARCSAIDKLERIDGEWANRRGIVSEAKRALLDAEDDASTWRYMHDEASKELRALTAEYRRRFPPPGGAK